MPETGENLLGIVNSCVYYARQIRDIYQVLPYSVDFKASRAALKSTKEDSTY